MSTSRWRADLVLAASMRMSPASKSISLHSSRHTSASGLNPANKPSAIAGRISSSAFFKQVCTLVRREHPRWFINNFCPSGPFDRIDQAVVALDGIIEENSQQPAVLFRVIELWGRPRSQSSMEGVENSATA